MPILPRHSSLALLLLLFGLAAEVSAQECFARHRLTPFLRGLNSETDVSDMDGDGDLDLVQADYPFVVSINDGSGRFITQEGAVSSLPGGIVFAPRFGRVGGGEAVDVLVMDSQDFLRGFEGDGLGGFQEVSVSHPAFSGGSATEARLIDLNGDGLDDYAFFSTNSFELWFNEGNWTFSAVSLPILPDTPTDVTFDDFDGDGSVDLIVAGAAGPAGSNNLLYLNDGAGTFVPVDTVIDDALTFTTVVEGFDYDGDGDKDVFVEDSASFTTSYSAFRNEGGGVFTDISALMPPSISDSATRWSESADLNGDGTESILILTSDGLAEIQYDPISDTFSIDVLISYRGDIYGNSFHVRDIDSDADFDLLLESSSFTLELYLNDGEGDFEVYAPDNETPWRYSSANALFDADLDGDLDAIVLGGGPGPRLLAGSFEGELIEVVGGMPLNTSSTSDIAIADLDADGLPDCVLGSTLMQFRNQGGLQFLDVPGGISGTATQGYAIALVDVDLDGFPDLVGGDGLIGNNGVSLFRNDGAGVLVEDAGAVVGSSINARSISTGDINGDGYIDVIAGSDTMTLNELLVNQGSGVLAVVPGAIPEDIYVVTATCLFDMDADGDLDLYLGQRALTRSGVQRPAAPDRLLENQAGNFVDVSGQLPFGVQVTHEVVSADFDGDGDQDLALLESQDPQKSESTDRVFIISNDGSGTFRQAHQVRGGTRSAGGAALAAGDVDGDGDTDLLVEDRVVVNSTLHLHASGLPRLGKRFDLEAYGPRNKQVFLAGSLTNASIPGGPHGVLRLDPMNAVVVGVATLDGAGRFTQSVDVPNNPTLLGFTSYWQALIGPPFRFTNAEMITLSGL